MYRSVHLLPLRICSISPAALLYNELHVCCWLRYQGSCVVQAVACLLNAGVSKAGIYVCCKLFLPACIRKAWYNCLPFLH